MTINLSGKQRFDTRGLPEGYDPHKLYEYRYQTLVKDATGLESFIYKYIPFSVIKSFAIAIDPFSQFKVAPSSITPVNRTRYRMTASVLNYRKLYTYRYRWGESHGPNYYVSACWNPVADHVDLSQSWTDNLVSQSPFPDYSKDTSRRTRLVGSSQGELELFKSYINSPPRKTVTGLIRDDLFLTHDNPPEPQCLSHGGINNPGTKGVDYAVREARPYGSVLSPSVFYARRSQEIDFAYAVMRDNAISMFKDWSPLKRDYSLFRNIVELRDLPHSVSQLRETLGNLKALYVSLSNSPKLRKVVFDLKANAKDVPKEYLSYNFGWKQTYSDVVDLLNLPNKLSKRFNFAIERAGKPTTFRTKRVLSFTESDVPGFDYEQYYGEYDCVLHSRVQREIELRLVINAVFDFPPLNSPSFRKSWFYDRVGAIPRPTDIYNLVPWTWLVDWFTGLGNYVEVIDNINHDSSLINWGMITAKVNGKLISEWQSKSDLQTDVRLDYVSVMHEIKPTLRVHTSQLLYEIQIRKDLAQILDVKTTSNTSSLSSYQKSILAALLAQRDGHFSKGR